ncbi:WecB/TagA/CpsF family glycosyltransferase [Pseudoalteromonas sp.]|uniref:WecB/TagA/CpsF family glycosyltransferase n=1 Tax=Pseudoalteromonas sp. TaxID=53249 RepID=UPI00261CDA13|nr:WecB/TagA/CpsF family glycosyltransferase [Pseudoalteromonas sp.]MCP4058033.1 WecB/TagA/CpsF family glycosyltransferase [Pseudoalteromonas sp.]MCP4585084.1 WecB/TagA/CpsF family glycosyltransferase [Pseudoalteromonas sp.]
MRAEQYILRMRTNVTSKKEVIELIKKNVSEKRGSYICVSNVHMCMETFDNPDFKTIVNQADLVIPDGRPLFWVQRLIGHKDASQIRGQDITEEVCRLSDVGELTIGFYGGADDTVLSKLGNNLKQKYPNIKIAYQFSPPFRPLNCSENKDVIKEINDSNVDVLFVGIGCPKQERWMAANRNNVNAVMLGVGAVFDFISGTKTHAPHWVQEIGLEWLYRLCCEPKRLWKRYLKQNPRFIWHVFCQVCLRKKYI